MLFIHECNSNFVQHSILQQNFFNADVVDKALLFFSHCCKVTVYVVIDRQQHPNEVITPTYSVSRFGESHNGLSLVMIHCVVKHYKPSFINDKVLYYVDPPHYFMVDNQSNKAIVAYLHFYHYSMVSMVRQFSS